MAATLDIYRKKRDFKATPEPSGKPQKAGKHLSFVVQKHAARNLHYDFRLELDGVLKSWAVPKGPSLDPKVKRMAIQVEDHPLDYATFEGQIPEGQYGAGTVIVWDNGTWEPQGDAGQGLAEGKLKFELHGSKLNGHFMLVRMHGREHERQPPWLLIKERDDQARATADIDVTKASPDSVLSDQARPTKRIGKARASRTASSKPAKAAKPAVDLEQQPKCALPLTFSPQLATLTDALPATGDWLYEIKFDGYRIAARVDKDQVRLYSRNGNDWTAKLTQLASEIKSLHLEPCWLDGEIVISDATGRSDFQSLQNAFDSSRRGTASAIQYYVFDMPFYGGYDLRSLGTRQRRDLLQQVLSRTASERVRFSDSFSEDPKQLLTHVCSMQMEGLIGKLADAPYQSSRSRSWIKLKCQKRQEFVIGGFTEPKGSRVGLGALLLGIYDQAGVLHYAGNVGTGFSEATLTTLKKQLDLIAAKASPFSEKIPGSDIYWVKPKLVGEVTFAEWTKDQRVRHAVFNGLRTDKEARSIIREQPQQTDPASAEPAKTTVVSLASDKPSPKKPLGKARRASGRIVATDDAKPATSNKPMRTTSTAVVKVDGVSISHAERVIDDTTGKTKGDLVAFYQAVSPWLIEHVKNRPVSLVRAPQGLAGPQVFQRHGERLRIPGLIELPANLWPEHPPLIALDTTHGIVGAAQMNAVEIHTWNARTDRIAKPDRIIFDLDPGENVEIAELIEATELTAGLLKDLGLASFLKTSGGKGMHVVVPMARRYGWDCAKAFSEAVVRKLAEVMPERFVVKSGAKNRIGRIFMDYLRNGMGATTASAFSARARAGLGVSMTLDLKQLKDVGSAGQWHIGNAVAYLKKRKADPWRDYGSAQPQRLEAAAKRLGHALTPV